MRTELIGERYARVAVLSCAGAVYLGECYREIGTSPWVLENPAGAARTAPRSL